MRGGYDKPTLQYVNRNMAPAMIFEVVDKPRREALINGGQERRSIGDFEIVPAKEVINFFASRTTPEINLQADSVSGELSKMDFYKKNAVEPVLDQYNQFIKDRITAGAVTEYLKGYAQSKGLESEVYFISGDGE